MHDSAAWCSAALQELCSYTRAILSSSLVAAILVLRFRCLILGYCKCCLHCQLCASQGSHQSKSDSPTSYLSCYLVPIQLRTGTQVWLAVPPAGFCRGLIGAFHDRLCHSGVNQTLAVMHQHCHWPGVEADVAAFIRQCHACQVRHLELNHVADVLLPRMSGPFRHAHIDLAGPFPWRQISAPVGCSSHGRTKKILSTEVIGHGDSSASCRMTKPGLLNSCSYLTKLLLLLLVCSMTLG